MHISSGRWLYGLFLALLTAVLWGVLPIKLKEVLQVMDPVTVTWYRLLVSSSIFIFRERFSVGQGLGLLVLLVGFALFFNQRLDELLTSLTAYTTGVLIVLLAA